MRVSSILLAMATAMTATAGLVKRGYPWSCYPSGALDGDPEVPESSVDEVHANLSLLFAWQFVSVTAMGTNFSTPPCDNPSSPYDMTCFVPYIINSTTTDWWALPLQQRAQVDPVLFASVVEPRVGCAADVDTKRISFHVHKYRDAMINALTHTTAKPEITDDKLVTLSKLFAYQVAGVFTDPIWVSAVCNWDIQPFRTGVDMIGLLVNETTEVLCGCEVDLCPMTPNVYESGPPDEFFKARIDGFLADLAK